MSLGHESAAPYHNIANRGEDARLTVWTHKHDMLELIVEPQPAVGSALMDKTKEVCQGHWCIHWQWTETGRGINLAT